ncbi:MptD family putative ECF transporter S component [Desulfoluna spongiiphila]|uniref:MptD family putative ECF transporter S component n=1 Tax=Desulfoluna spongiiphila TaxID=419481 RepID=UPI0012558292|nr:MptD family putative ECF transporter S component [Desulfoluna spongiiphila]VVS94829.1 conserved hypothetical chp02185 integral membrane [Desulfoluna spongiiphila]
MEKTPYWEMRDLVTIGIFAAVTKVTSLLVALVGGGMNPITLILKNLLFTTLAIVLLYKVRKFGALTLFLLVNILVSLLLMGGSLVLIPAMVLAGIVAEAVIMTFGGYARSANLIIGVGLYDIVFKVSSVGASWLYMREQQEMVIMSAIIVGIGYIGAFLGLFSGAFFVKELRHACIIRS